MRRWVISVTATVVGVVLGIAPAGASSSGEWTQSFGGAAHHNENRSEKAITASTVGHLHKAWLMRGPHDDTKAGPAVVHGVVYVVDETRPSNGYAHLVALRASNGHRIWSHKLPKGYDDDNLSPAVSHGRVFVALTGTPQDRGDKPAPELNAAYSAKIGHKLWATAEPPVRQGLDNDQDSWFTVADNRTFTVVDDGYLTARSATTGKIEWRDLEADVDSTPGAGGDPTYADSHLFIQGDDETVTALNPVNGKTQFTDQASLGPTNQISVSDGRVVAGGTSSAAAFSAKGCTTDYECKPLWTRTWSVQENVYLSALDSSHAFFIGREQSPGTATRTNIYALNAKNGDVLWQGSLPADLQLGDLTRADNVLLGTTSETGHMYAWPVSCHSPCSPIWSRRIGPKAEDDWTKSDPVVVGNRVFVSAMFYGLTTWTVPRR